MEADDFNQLTEFVFDQSTPESDEETRIEETQDAPPSHDSTPRPGRIIRKRARKACVACHKRYTLFNLKIDRLLIEARKVRCDVLSRGHTCTNCRLDGITCVIRSGYGTKTLLSINLILIAYIAVASGCEVNLQAQSRKSQQALPQKIDHRNWSLQLIRLQLWRPSPSNPWRRSAQGPLLRGSIPQCQLSHFLRSIALAS
jgi:hypothetical protein